MITLKLNHTIRIPLEHGMYEIHNKHDFEIRDDFPEEYDRQNVFEITNETQNVTDIGMSRQYWRTFALTDGDDIRFVAVEVPMEEFEQ